MASITLADTYGEFDSLDNEESRDIIFRRSLEQLKAGDRQQVEALKIYVITSATDDQKELLRSQLAEISLGPDVLEMFSSVFPEEMDKILEKHRVNLSFDISNDADPVLLQAAEIILGRPHFFQSNPKAKQHYHIRFDNFSTSERQIPDRTEVVRYSSHEVNLVGAFLTMPRGASYIYDIHTGGVSVGYRGRLTITDGKADLSSRVISDVVELTYSYCDNARIQNVFGGVERAQFVANADMQGRCAMDSKSVDYRYAYNQVAKRIAEEVLSLPELKRHIQP